MSLSDWRCIATSHLAIGIVDMCSKSTHNALEIQAMIISMVAVPLKAGTAGHCALLAFAAASAGFPREWDRFGRIKSALHNCVVVGLAVSTFYSFWRSVQLE
jgi:hypothetical protein